MGMTASKNSSLRSHQLVLNANGSLPPPELQHETHCRKDSSVPGECPLADVPTVLLHILMSYNLDPADLARLEATCSFFRQPAAVLLPEVELSITEFAALEMCRQRAIFKPMKAEEREELKERCGSSWKLVLKFLLAGEVSYRREKVQVCAGDGHSIVVMANGDAYTFGLNSNGQLGRPSTKDSWRPQRCLKGVRIIQVASSLGRTRMVTDSGQVYAIGPEKVGEAEHEAEGPNFPIVIESLKGIFVVQVAIGKYFTAVLSREGRVYTFDWGNEEKTGHESAKDAVPYPLTGGTLEDVLVVQIAAGNCYLLALAFKPSGMSVYSVGCGLGGKLGHGSDTNEKRARLIEHFQTLDFEPVAISAGPWHAAAVARDGRVCTWGWGKYGCLGHGDEDYQPLPKVVEELGDGKAVHVATGNTTSFVVLDNGNVYSFGVRWFGILGHYDPATIEGQLNRDEEVLTPELAASLKQLNERVVQISLSNSPKGFEHAIVLTESGKIFAFGRGGEGQLGIKLSPGHFEQREPVQIKIET